MEKNLNTEAKSQRGKMRSLDTNGEGKFARFGKIQKGIFIVPSLITSAAFFCGFFAMVSSIKGDFYTAAWAIILAIFLDGLDGRVARAMGATSDFGVQYDSLSDLVAFGVAPAVLMYNWALHDFGRIGWMAGFLFVICGALRLARFNTQSTEERKSRFVGMPIPAAAGLLAVIVLLTKGAFDLTRVPAILLVITIYVLAILMVSNVTFRNFKGIDLTQRRSFPILLAVILAAFVIVQFPNYMLFAMGIAYAVDGPVVWYMERRDKPWSRLALDFFGLDKQETETPT